MAIILGIESTCDETAAAVVVDGRRVLSNVIASQVELHAKYRGVVPEIASRAHIENILPVIREAINIAGVEPSHLDAIAVAHRPGLIGSLLIGVTAAKTLAWSLGKPLIAVDHVQAHLYSVMLQNTLNTEGPSPSPGTPGEGRGEGDFERNTLLDVPNHPHPNPLPEYRERGPEDLFPAIGLVCSGGHTALYHIQSWSELQMIGSTIDDAVGEAYDKVAAILGLGYPGGPIIDRLATDGNPTAVKLPRSMLDRESLDFSFSGLKTAVLYHVRGVPTRREPHPSKPPPSQGEINDIAASFQSACIDVITRKIKRAIEQYGAKSVLLGGGVSANRGLRAALKSLPVVTHFPQLECCTDNAAMIGGLADVHFRAGTFAALDLDAITYSQFRR